MKVGLKESKKYATGSVHENGGGKFEILDRYFDEKTDAIMLKYKFLNDGRVEDNKEANVNASEWKWRKVRGLAGNAGNRAEAEALGEESYANHKLVWEETIEGLYVRLERLIKDNHLIMQECKKAFDDQNKMLHGMNSVIQLQQNQIDTLLKESNIINKLLEKIK